MYIHNKLLKMIKNKIVRYSYEKNELLKKDRGVSFDDVVLAVENGDLLDDITHPNKERYPNQDIFIIFIMIKNYVYLVPYVETEKEIFLKTIIPSRKMTKKYKKGAKDA